MCGPLAVPLITLAITAAASAASVSAARSAAKNQAQAQNDYNRSLEQNALTARNANLQNLEIQRNQALDDTREQINRNSIAERQAAATTRVASGEAGISGLTVDALLRDLGGQAGFDNSTAYTNYLRQDQAINVQRENVNNNYVSTLQGQKMPTIQSPNYLGAALQIGQAAVSSYGQYQDNVARLNKAQT